MIFSERSLVYSKTLFYVCPDKNKFAMQNSTFTKTKFQFFRDVTRYCLELISNEIMLILLVLHKNYNTI